MVLSISLFAGVQSWANVWERFWVPDGPAGQWGSSSEKGLSAAYCFLLAGGMGCDWMLRYRFGENPDQVPFFSVFRNDKLFIIFVEMGFIPRDLFK